MKNLVTLDEFKTYKDISSTEKDDLLSGIIDRVSGIVKSFCKRDFIDYYSTPLTQYFDGINVETVYLKEYPIGTVTSVSISYDGGVTYTALTETLDFFVNYEDGSITAATGYFIPAGYSSIPAGVSNRTLKIIYTGGYLKCPDDLKQAVLDLVNYYYKNEYTPRQDFQSFKLENVGFRSGDGLNFPSHVHRILGQYREL